MAHVSDFEDAVIFYVDVIGDEGLVHIPSFVDVIESHCDLQPAVHQSFGVEVFVLVAEKPFIQEVSQSLPFQLLEEDQEFPMR